MTTEPLKTRPEDQPLPVGGQQCVQDALIADIQARRDIGIQRYGSALMTQNGRDAVQDALEEAVDLAVYLKQVHLETVERREALARVHAVREEWAGHCLHPQTRDLLEQLTKALGDVR